jgi:hypothetical protein
MTPLYQRCDTHASAGRFPFYADTIPEELIPGDYWVCCDEDKVPMIARMKGQRRAKSSDPATWRSFDAARAAYDAGCFAGVGRVISKDEDLVGVDLDHCRNPETGAITPHAREVLDALDSYSEVSPSGTGIKVWVHADLSRSYVKPGFECYHSGRYFTVTGQILSQYPATVEARSTTLAAILAKEFPPRPKVLYPALDLPTSPPPPGVHRPLELRGFLDHTEVEVLCEVVDEREAEIKFQILCPWIDEHTTAPESGCFVGQYPSGALFFHCWHSHCAHRQWRDFRHEVSARRKTIQIAPRGCAGAHLEVIVDNG